MKRGWGLSAEDLCHATGARLRRGNVSLMLARIFVLRRPTCFTASMKKISHSTTAKISRRPEKFPRLFFVWNVESAFGTLK